LLVIAILNVEAMNKVIGGR